MKEIKVHTGLFSEKFKIKGIKKLKNKDNSKIHKKDAKKIINILIEFLPRGTLYEIIKIFKEETL